MLFKNREKLFYKPSVSRLNSQTDICDPREKGLSMAALVN